MKTSCEAKCLASQLPKQYVPIIASSFAFVRRKYEPDFLRIRSLTKIVHALYFTGYPEGQLELFGFNIDYAGIIKMQIAGVWGSFCANDWSINEATVVCR